METLDGIHRYGLGVELSHADSHHALRRFERRGKLRTALSRGTALLTGRLRMLRCRSSRKRNPRRKRLSLTRSISPSTDRSCQFQYQQHSNGTAQEPPRSGTQSAATSRQNSDATVASDAHLAAATSIVVPRANAECRGQRSIASVFGDNEPENNQATIAVSENNLSSQQCNDDQSLLGTRRLPGLERASSTAYVMMLVSPSVSISSLFQVPLVSIRRAIRY